MPITRYAKKELAPRPEPRRDYSTALMIISELVIVSLIGWITVSYGMFPKKKQSQVLSASTGVTATPAPLPTLEPTVTVLPSPTPQKLSKDTYTLLIIGDSMEDTMGEKLDYLQKALTEKYPETKFNLYNYGKGANNVEEARSWFAEEFHYKDRNYPLPYQTHPDISIVGSFAYNPFTPYDRDRHWLGLTHLIQEIQKISPEVYILAENAPLKQDFGKGPQGVNWDSQTASVQSAHIVEQLENAVGLSKALNVPLIDAYHESTDESKLKKYVSPQDGIHPSTEGHEMIAKKIVETIVFK